MSNYADYIYKNFNDTKRFKIFKVCEDNRISKCHWDVDIWDKETDSCFNFGEEMADIFYTKKEAKQWIEENYGKVKSLGNIDSVTDGWQV